VDQARILAGQREVAMRTDGRGRLLVMGDPDRLKQVVLVLLDNALKYGRQTPDGWARLSVGRQHGQALLTVEDNGPGIAPDDLPHIFERFYRAERAARLRRMTGAPASPPANAAGATGAPHKAEGSGLGLAIAQAIARAHGGALTVQSVAGSGTAFTLSLPLAPGAASASRTSTSSTTSTGEAAATRPPA
jgi:signal transduction histidine kinase